MINRYLENRTSDLLNKYGAFFAFSNDQFDEKKAEGAIYVQIFAGLLCPKPNAEKLVSEYDELFDKAILECIAECGAERIIEYAYFNHESQITMDNRNALSALDIYIEARPDLFTDDVISRVFRECWKTAIREDLF